MKLVTFNYGEGIKLGAIVEDKVIDLQKAYLTKLNSEGIPNYKVVAETVIPYDPSLFFQGGKKSLTAAKEAIQFVTFTSDNSSVYSKESVVIGPPVTNPKKIICVGHNYREHILEMKREIPEYPVVFAKFSNTVIGPQDDIPFYSITEKLDYEAEFGVVIGRKAKFVKREDALDYVAGYTIVNDVTARDLQKRTLQWLQGKSVDGSAPMGPWLVTTDELPDPSGLEMVLTVNGEERQRTNTKNLVFNVPHLIEYLSSIMTLVPGDVICTGTPGGVGVAMDPPKFLSDGDVVKIEIENIGVLENKVRRINQEGIKDYIAQIQTKVNTFVEVVNQTPSGAIDWKASSEKWSVKEIVSHMEEANRYWIHELLRVLNHPETKFGRGFDHPGRLKAVEDAKNFSLKEIVEKFYEFKFSLHEKLLTIYDEDLQVNATHKNPKFGTKPLSFLLEHFVLEHMDNHIEQVKRNIVKYKEQGGITDGGN